MKRLNFILPLFFLTLSILLFFFPIFQGKIPVPTDTIVGLYHPYRDYYANEYPRGITFKNALITDPVRQQFPWRLLSISLIRRFELPLWNPYSLSGTPLLGNFQSGAFYPINIIFFIFPFTLAWSVLIIIQPILGSFFLYVYLRYFQLRKSAAILGSVVFAFCGFSIAWLEWNTIVHVVIWLPLILLAMEKLLRKINPQWIAILIFAEISSFFAGHLQVLFYTLILSNAYLFARILQLSWYPNNYKKSTLKIIRTYIPFLLIGLIVFLLTAIQWLPTLQFIKLSARDSDLSNYLSEGWFIPWQHIIQFFVPDFFGNPTTLNYWGLWNYGEFIGYVGIFPLLMSLFAMFFRHDKKTFFFGTIFFVSLIFAYPTFIGKLPYLLHIPFISNAQPTRLLVLTDFSLAVLSALGFDYFLKQKKGLIFILSFLSIIFLLLWMVILFGGKAFHIQAEFLLTAKRNLLYSSSLYGVICISVVVSLIFKKIKIQYIIFVFLLISLVDLIRFGQKFTPFTNPAYLYPSTRAITFVKKNINNYRYMSTDSRIFPPNFGITYKLQSIDGYDPLYLKRYGELIASGERGRSDISSPFGFNRIITPHNPSAKFINLLGVKFIFSFSEIQNDQFKKVFEEGQTKVYLNKAVFPRAFFVNQIVKADSKQDAIRKMYSNAINLKKTAIIETEGKQIFNEIQSTGYVTTNLYSENRVILSTVTQKTGFLVLTDTFYPTWKAKIYSSFDTKSQGTPLVIYRTDYNFRGVFVQPGKNVIEFYQDFF